MIGLQPTSCDGFTTSDQTFPRFGGHDPTKFVVEDIYPVEVKFRRLYAVAHHRI
jgi:hypothetical protein